MREQIYSVWNTQDNEWSSVSPTLLNSLFRAEDTSYEWNDDVVTITVYIFRGTGRCEHLSCPENGSAVPLRGAPHPPDTWQYIFLGD